MEIQAYVQALQYDLAAAAAVAGDEVSREAGQRLSQAIESALHLRLLDLLGELSLSLTAQVPGRVEVRLVGREPELVYVEEEEQEPAQPTGSDDAFSARITLRLPDVVKAQIEVAATAEGASVNTWIVRALQRGLEPRTRSVRTGRRLSGYADS